MENQDVFDALLLWVSAFNEGAHDFVENPNLLLDGISLSKVYNQLVAEENQIDLSAIKPIKDLDDWVNILLIMRLISAKITPLLKQSGIENTVDVTNLARKKDHGELLKLLKNLLFFSVKSPNRKLSIQRVRSLEKQHMMLIQSVLEEIMPKKAPQQSAPKQPEQQQQQQQMQSKQETNHAVQEIDQQISDLTARKQRLDNEIAEAEKSNKELESGSSGKMTELLNDATRRHQQVKEKRDKLKRKLEETEELLNKSRAQLDELRPQQEMFLAPVSASASTEKSNEELKAKLESLQAGILAEMRSDPKVAAEIEKNPPAQTSDYVKLLGIAQLTQQMDEMKQDLEAIERNTQVKEAELNALSHVLEEQNKKSANTLRLRISQINNEIDSSPIGDARRLSIKYQRVIKKLESDIEGLKQGCSDMEVEELQKQLTIMAKRKAIEGDLLAKKQALVQATAEQCDIRLERLKVSIELQMHSSRISKWKNCFATPKQ